MGNKADKSKLRAFFKRYRKRTASVFGLCVTFSFIFVALLAPFLAPFGLMDLSAAFQPPSSIHLLGTDSLGQDVLTCVIYGARASLLVGIFAVLTSTIIGLIFGSISGFYGGRIDDILMRVTEVFQVLPRFFLAIIFVAFFGPSLWNIIIIIGILTWPTTARLLRAEFLALNKREFVDAARVMGMDDFRLISNEILPNAIAPIIVNASLEIASAILLEASLSFLGLGDPSMMSWGVMLHNSQEYFNRAWWMAVFPGTALFLTTLGLNLLGDGLNDALNPRLRGRI